MARRKKYPFYRGNRLPEAELDADNRRKRLEEVDEEYLNHVGEIADDLKRD